MSSTPAPVKTCLICGLDVSNKPRVKDSQGRYTCKECLDRAVKAKAAQQQARSPSPAPAAPGSPAPAPADEPVTSNAFLLDLGKPSLKDGQHACPNCARPVMNDAKICVNCGMNQQTGQRLHIQVHKPETKTKPKA